MNQGAHLRSPSYNGQENENLHPDSHKPRVTNPKSDYDAEHFNMSHLELTLISFPIILLHEHEHARARIL